MVSVLLVTCPFFSDPLQMVRFLLSVGADPGLVSAAGSCVAIAPTPLIRTILQDVMKGEREGGEEHQEDGSNTLVVEIGMSDGIDKVILIYLFV